MNIYILIENDEIIDLNTEEIDETYEEYSVSNIDEFLEKTKKYKISIEIESKLKDLLEESIPEIKLSSFNIKHWVSNRSFGELIDMFENNEIIIPDMQREFVWDSLKCSRFIESIILGLPIPPLFLLETDNNRYEIIDGFQRLTTLVNYVTGKPWYDNPLAKRKITSVLSGKVSEEVAGKRFSELAQHHQRIIKRSTIPLIEFKQFEPDNMESKYLIFERINTGSEKLNSMQIRKALAHGKFMKSLYEKVNTLNQFKILFSTNRLKKDEHIEAFLRIKVMSDIFYRKYSTDITGIKYILNNYCEIKREEEVSEEFIDKFTSIIEFYFEVFKESKEIFKRVEMVDKEYKFIGNMNISIMDSLVGVLLNEETKLTPEKVKENYVKIINKTYRDSIEHGIENPFTTSTGILVTILKRYEIARNILGVS